MKDEAPTILPFIGFAVTVILAARVIITYNLRFARSTKRLKHAYVAAGRNWDYMTDLAFRRRLFCEPTSILEASDSADIRNAKEELITCRKDMPRLLWKAIKFVFWGFGGIILLMILESVIRHFL